MTQDILATGTSPSQASFLFPTPPALQEETLLAAPSSADRQADAAPAAALPPAGSEAKPAQNALRVPIIIAVVGGVIGLGPPLVTSLLSGHSDDQKVRIEARKTLRKEILDKSSGLVLALRAARKTLVYDGPEAAAPARARYDAATKDWYGARADMVDRAQTLFGAEFALLVDAPSGKNIIVDQCGVVVTRDNPQRRKNCAARLDREVAVLTARQDAVNAGQSVAAQEVNALIPGDFTTSLKIANRLLNRVSACKMVYTGLAAKLHPPVSTRCPNLKQLQNDLNVRVNLLGIRSEEIARQLPRD